MALPLSFLAGLVLAMLHGEVDQSLPGEGSLGWLMGCVALLLLPWAAALRAPGRVARLAMMSAPDKLLRRAARAPVIAGVVAYGVLLFVGGYPMFVARWAPESQAAQAALLLAPLFIVEIASRWAEERVSKELEVARRALPLTCGPGRLRAAAFIAAPFLALAAVADLVAMNRQLDVFFNETSLGVTAGLLLVVLVLCVTLPLIFRLVMPLSRELPPAVAGDLRRTAAALGFKGDSVLSMRTHWQLVNAAMVGPAPWPRFLVLTDGLLALLDPLSLRGVVAHEAGHARANHPALLVLVFAVIPLLLFFPVMATGALEPWTTWSLVGVFAVLAAAVVVFRMLAHRFEHEADQLSAEALGGASYCVQALRRIGELSPRTVHRTSFRHPSERGRIEHLFRCEAEPEYRERFWRRGRWVRAAIAGCVIAALGCSAWSQRELWPIDRAAYLFYCGRLADAQTQLASLPADLSEPQRRFVDRLEAEVAAGLSLRPGVTTWDEVQDGVAPEAFKRAEELLAGGASPEHALKWLGLALYKRGPEDWLQSLYLYCRAVEMEDQPQADRVRRHLLRLDVPEPIRAALD